MPVPKQVLFGAFSALILCLSGGCGGAQPSATPAPPPVKLTDTLTPLPEGPTVSVPRGEPPVIDGRISAGEWEGASVETFANGGRLVFIYHDGFLYLAIRAGTGGMIAGNVLLARGDEIVVLHASAALGTGIYRREADGWRLVQGFTWRCRDTGESQAAQDEREAFLREEGWVATNSYIGAPNELEYRIETTGEALRLAVNYILASQPGVKIPWPDALEDGSVQPTPGGLPERLEFSPEQWARIVILP